MNARASLALGLGAGCCLLAIACSAAVAQTQLAQVVDGCKMSLDIARRQGDTAREKAIAAGCNAALDVWAADGADAGQAGAK